MSNSKKTQSEKHEPMSVNIQNYDAPKIILDTPEDFLKVVSKENPKYVFWNIDADRKGNAGILQSGLMLSTEVNGYCNYAELVAGYQLGFVNGDEYREASSIGAENFNEYSDLKASGYSDIEKYRNIMKTSLPRIYKCWKENLENLLPRKDRPVFTNLLEFIQSGILDKTDFNKSNPDAIIAILKAGFWRVQDYTKAQEIGFSDADNFFTAQEYGITTTEEYEEFNLTGITSKPHWDMYKKESEAAKAEGFSNILGKLLFDLYDSGSIKSTWTVKKIHQHIEIQIIKKFKMSEGYYWEIPRASDIKSITTLTTHPDIKHLVVPSFDLQTILRRSLEPEELKTANLDLCNIILDGYNRSDAEREGDVSKILVIIRKLREFNIKTINVFADATHVYYLKEDEIKKITDSVDLFVPVKKGFSADAYMLDFAQNNPSFIVTNDQFSEHRSEKNPWIFNNIPRILVGFTFNDHGEVHFGDKEYELHPLM